VNYVISNKEMREFDRRSVEFIPEMILMEHAGRLMAGEILRDFPRPAAVAMHILTGPGHNGGDALVVARHLADEGVSSTVWLVRDELGELPARMAGGLDPAFVTLRSLEPSGWELLLKTLEALSGGPRTRGEEGETILVDGWLGSGISRPLPSDGPAGELPGLWNRAAARRYALDIPSGLSDDYRADWPVLRTDVTLAVQYPRRVMYSEPARDCCGEIRIIEPGFPAALRRELESGLVPLSADADLPALIPPMNPGVHKGDRGRLEVIGGAEGMEGAAILAARACVRSGAGMVRVATPSAAAAQVIEADPALMHRRIADGDADSSGDPGADGWARGLLIGPGLGRGDTGDRLTLLLRDLLVRDLPTVIDADGLHRLNALITAGMTDFPRSAPLILTPHAGEAAAFSGMPVDQVLRDPGDAACVIINALPWNDTSWVILKSSVTHIAGPRGLSAIVDGREPSLATAGSGDVLAGVTAGLLLRLGDGERACAAAVLAHRRAGVRCHRRWGYYGAAELAEEAGRVLGELDFFEGGPA
jgi:hydroxyethylthiazole kinase-like uncharacterized protein yjeF